MLLTLICAGNMLWAQVWNGSIVSGNYYLHTDPATTNVGIGTTTPSCRLQIWKSALDANYPNITCLGLFNDNTTGSKVEIAFGNRDAVTLQPAPRWALGVDPINDGSKDFYLYCVNNQKFPFFVKDALTSSDLTNKVGINTNSPETELHLKGMFRVQNPAVSSGRMDIQYNSANANIDAHGGSLLLNWYSDNLVRVGQNTADLFVSNRTYSQQGIGIGTGISTLDAKLHIESNDASGLGRIISVTSPGSLGRTFSVYADGRVFCRRVEVLAGIVPDYVFNPDYKLMSLSELERYVQHNRHLPNIPSEQEFHKKGSIDMSELQMKLLEKVEELTLYIIQQQKEIEELKQKKGEK